MKISLIAPPLMDYQNGILMPISMDSVRTCPPYGIYLLATVLAQYGHQVVIVDLIAQGSKRLDDHWGHLLSSQLIGIGTTSLSWPTGKECLNEIRRYTKTIPIILGGIHATMFDNYLLATTEANFVVRGEAEKSVPMLCHILENGGDLRAVSGITFKSPDGKIIRNKAGQKMTAEELSALPLPDYSMVPPNVYTGLGIESSRGCPFDCIFCSTSYRKSWRGVSPERFADKVEQLIPYTALTNGGIVQIIDDEFSVKTKRAIAICDEFRKRNLNFKMVFDSRANDVLKEEFINAILPFAKQFLIGAECGYDEGLKKVGKGCSTKNLEKAASILKKYNIAHSADFSFVIGLPWEEKKDVLKTVKFAFHLYATYGVRVLLQWYCQIPGSRLWAEQKDKEILHEAQYDDYGFFRNHYLFRTGVRLLPSEIHEVMNIIDSLKTLSTKNNQGLDMFQNSLPEPIQNLYPFHPVYNTNSSLMNLRELSNA